MGKSVLAKIQEIITTAELSKLSGYYNDSLPCLVFSDQS